MDRFQEFLSGKSCDRLHQFIRQFFYRFKNEIIIKQLDEKETQSKKFLKIKPNYSQLRFNFSQPQRSNINIEIIVY